METKELRTLEVEFDSQKACDLLRPLILRSRDFRRGASFGMKIWRGATYNADTGTYIEHIEIACPSYTLTERGPVIERKTKEE